jgi:hypothetical protein
MRQACVVATLGFLLSLAGSAIAQTEITYQGQLKRSGTAYTGTPDMTFRLFDQFSGGNQVGPTLTRTGVPVEDGLFRVELDFGAVYAAPRWLEIEVEGATLSPRQRLDVAPRSVRALSVGGLPVGEACSEREFCRSGICDDSVCAAPTCADGVQNGNETGIDCGGGACSPCRAGRGCGFAGDCVSEVCFGRVCQRPACDDGVFNGQETDTDCGGPDCSACTAGSDCSTFEDCISGVCDNDICAAPACADGVRNGSETDVDCGGPDCAGCAAGKLCEFNADCASGNCDSRICQ